MQRLPSLAFRIRWHSKSLSPTLHARIHSVASSGWWRRHESAGMQMQPLVSCACSAVQSAMQADPCMALGCTSCVSLSRLPVCVFQILRRWDVWSNNRLADCCICVHAWHWQSATVVGITEMFQLGRQLVQLLLLPLAYLVPIFFVTIVFLFLFDKYCLVID